MCDSFHIFAALLSLYCDIIDRRQIATEMKRMMKNPRENNTMDGTLSESSVSLKLSLIQKRCSELMDEPDSLGLSLEDAEQNTQNSGDPYNHLK